MSMEEHVTAWLSESRQQQAAAFHYFPLQPFLHQHSFMGPKLPHCGDLVLYAFHLSVDHISEAAHLYSNSWWQCHCTQITDTHFSVLPSGIATSFAHHKHNAIIMVSLWENQRHFVCNRRAHFLAHNILNRVLLYLLDGTVVGVPMVVILSLISIPCGKHGKQIHLFSVRNLFIEPLSYCLVYFSRLRFQDPFNLSINLTDPPWLTILNVNIRLTIMKTNGTDSVLSTSHPLCPCLP